METFEAGHKTVEQRRKRLQGLVKTFGKRGLGGLKGRLTRTKPILVLRYSKFLKIGRTGVYPPQPEMWGWTDRAHFLRRIMASLIFPELQILLNHR